MYTPEEINSLIKKEMHLAELPLNLSFNEAGFKNVDLQKIQTRLSKTYHKTVATILYIDTTYTLTDKLNGKKESNQ